MGQAGYRGVAHARAGMLCAAVLPLLLASPVAADPPRGALRLEWSAPEGSGCADYDEIRAQAERLSGRTLFAASGASAEGHTIAGTVEPHETTWRARITLRDGSGRELGAREVLGRSPTCRTLNVPVALVIVTLADSLLGPPEPGETWAPEPPSFKPRVTRPNEGEGEGDASGERPGKLLGLGAFAALDASVLPSATPGVGLAIELRLPLPVSLDGAVFAPVEELDAQGRGARMYLSHGGIAVCPEIALAPASAWRAQLCAAGQLGAISASGQGLTRATSAARLIAVLGFEPKLVWQPSDGLAVRMSVLSGWVAIRPSFRMDIEGQAPRVLRSAPILLQLRLGIMGFAF